MTARAEKTTRIPELDGVRGLACLLVLIWHYFMLPLNVSQGSFAGSVYNVAGYIGRSGVDLFFVLSGFLISGILIDHRNSPNYFRTFYIRRVCRIMPVYMFVCLVAIAFFYGGAAVWFPAINDWLLKDMMPMWSYPIYVQNFYMAAEGHAGGKFLAMTWSVAVEEQFYLLFPFFVYFFPLRWLRYFVLGTIVASPILRLIAIDQQVWFYTLLPCRIDCLATGILAAMLIRNPTAKAFLAENKGLLYASMLGLIACMIYLSGQTLWYTWIALFYAAGMLLVILHPTTLAARFCRRDRLRHLGLISYGVYMYHQPVQGLCHAILGNQAPRLRTVGDVLIILLSTAISVGFAYVSYHAVESRLLALGHRAKWWPQSPKLSVHEPLAKVA